ADGLRRKPAEILAGWTMGGIRFQRVAPVRDLRGSVPRDALRARRQAADLDQRRNLSALAAGWQRDLLRWTGWTLDGGGSECHGQHNRSRTGSAAARYLYAHDDGKLSVRRFCRRAA